jgi:hypothetical protein
MHGAMCYAEVGRRGSLDLPDGLLPAERPGPISAGPVIESFEDRLELIASGQAIAVLPVGDRRRSLRADLATVPVEGLPPAWVAGLALS